ncbi:MAG: segregation/condensation protein A [Candidatus Vogelbacteria bacterium]|nr:segregation/condensation protein A [Candidatus Vogelbacteria bacterium]
MTEPFAVRVDEFEGPLPLLLELVEKRQLAINRVSLAQVADDFLNYVKERESPTMAILAEFLVVASTLMLIKSISLLPSLTVDESESGDINELERRLQLYQVIRQAALALGGQFGQRPIFFPSPRRSETVIFSPSAELTTSNLLAAMKNLLAALPVNTASLPRATVKKIMSLEEMVKNLTSRVQTALQMNFSEFIRDKKEKINIIVGFLALLELCKQGLVEVEQKDHFDEIKIESKQAGIPRY